MLIKSHLTYYVDSLFGFRNMEYFYYRLCYICNILESCTCPSPYLQTSAHQKYFEYHDFSSAIEDSELLIYSIKQVTTLMLIIMACS